MRASGEEKAIGCFVIVCLVASLIFGIGYIANVVKLLQCDFQAPYKSEVIRGVGIFVPFVGAPAGYLRIEDGVTND